MLRTSIAATTLALLTSTSALALEGKALLEKIIADNGSKMTYGAIEETGPDSVRLSDVKIVDGGTTVSMNTVALEGFREAGDRIELDRSTTEGLAMEFPLAPEQRKSNPDGKGALRIASGTSEKVVAPAGAILAVSLEELAGLKGRMDVGSYVLRDVTADFDGDGTFETSMKEIALNDLSSPLEFRYDPEAVKTATGPAPEPLTLGSFSVDDTKVVGPQGEFTLGNVSLKGMTLPATIAAEPQDWAQVYDTFTMGPMQFAVGSKPLFKLDTLSASIAEGEGSVIRSKSNMEGLFVDAATIAGPKGAALQALGYETFTGRMEGTGGYDFETGEVEVENLLVDLDDVAELSFSYKMTGYTPEIARQLNELSVQASGGKQPDPMAYMQILSQLKLDGATIALKDDSLTQRLLAFQAAQMKTTPDQLAAGAPMFLGIGMAQLGMPEFTTEVSSAVGTFLKNPGTLTVAAKPADPVSFGDLMVAAQQAPKAVIEMLNVGVEASN